MNPNQALVQSLYDAFAKGDVPAFLARLDPKVVWNEAEGFFLSDKNPYVGHDAIVQGVFARIMTEYEGFRVVPKELAGDGSVITMFGRYVGTHAKTKKPLDVQCAHTWWIRDGKIVRFQQMVDTAAAAKTRA